MIEFKTIKWKNFLSTGNNFTTIDLCSNNKTLIIGENGAGKSTILDALCFCLFNKPFRKINKPQLINTINQGDCVVEIDFTIGKVDWKVIRGMKPNVFEIYKNDVLLDQASASSDQQKWLEQNVLKLNYKSFTQIVVLGSSTFVPFMQLPAAGRREVIEDILDIRIFSTMNTILKERLKQSKDVVTELNYEISVLKEKVDVQKRFIDDLRQQSNQNINEKNDKVSFLEEEIEQAEESIKDIGNEINLLTADQIDIDLINTQFDDLKSKYYFAENKIKEKRSEHKFFSENDVCPTCNQDINKNLKEHKTKSSEDEIESHKILLKEVGKEIDLINKIKISYKESNSKISNLNSKIQSFLQEIKWKTKQITDLRKEISTIENNDGNVFREKEKLKDLISFGIEKEKEYRRALKVKAEHQIVADILKDNGVKSTIIKKYLPVMNHLINKYLGELEFYVNFTLDENFNEIIKSRHRDEFSYASFSEGEKMRIDLSLLFTWREVAKLKNSVNTNLLILDEVFDSSLDSNGTQEFIGILRNITEGNNVFVISHKGDLLHDKFDNVIEFKKVKNFSKPTQSNGTTT